MNIVIYLLVGLLIGGIGGYFIGKKQNGRNLTNNAERIKSENMAKLKEYLSKETDGKINNEDVRKLLGVSDTTACRYLDDLEKEGLVKQIGTDGPEVYYQKN